MLTLLRFSDVLNDASALLPGAPYDRDPTVNYQIHRAILYTMATCHSLHAVGKELLGDPLDIKMFEFTGWIFEELAQNIDASGDLPNRPTSISRPPAGLEYNLDEFHESMAVRAFLSMEKPLFADSIVGHPDRIRNT